MGDYRCQNCGHKAPEDDFWPSDGNPAPHICPGCGSTECFSAGDGRPVLTTEFLALDLCEAILGEEDQEEIVGKAALLQSVLQADWGSIEGYEPVFHEDELVGIVKR